jgi:CelD/BcsL family acetyltransferase involved in cellulose biosynthesis
MIDITFEAPGSLSDEQWDDLVARAEPNVFMSPAALQAVQDTSFAKVHVLMAWAVSDDSSSRRLVGLWAMRERRSWRFGPVILDALPYNYAFLSNPVIDHAFGAPVMQAFMAALATTKALPRVIGMKSIATSTAAVGAMLAALEAQGGRVTTVKTQNRPILMREQIKLSGERRRKMRQGWKRLSSLGAVEVVFTKDPDAIAEPLETFLELEHKSWKGANGTALLCNDTDAAFIRVLVRRLSEKGQAAIEALTLDGRTIATQVILRSGSMAYTWKTAYDHNYSRYSPGLLLVDKLTERVAERPEIAGIDSCSMERSFMADLWSARQPVADLLVDSRSGLSLTFAMESGRQVARETLKQLRDRLVDLRDARRAKAAKAAATAAAAASAAATAEAGAVLAAAQLPAEVAADIAIKQPKPAKPAKPKKAAKPVLVESLPFEANAPALQNMAVEADMPAPAAAEESQKTNAAAG